MHVVRASALSWLFTTLAFAVPPTTEPTVITAPARGVVTAGQQVEWKIQPPLDTALTYRVKQNGAKVIASGPVPADGVIHGSLPEPGTLLLDLLRTEDGKPAVARSAGAAVSPEQIKPAAEAPEDFDAFWKAQLGRLAEVPPNAQLTSRPSERNGIDYWSVTLDNVDGKHVQAQLARPAGNKRLPAMVVYQWAGVYALQKGWVTGPAADGWLVLNVSAHDLPIDREDAFYDQQTSGPMKSYVAIGNTSRDTSYFRTMLLGNYQAIEYLTHRSDWDGKTLIVRGGSQGGFQAHRNGGPAPGGVRLGRARAGRL